MPPFPSAETNWALRLLFSIALSSTSWQELPIVLPKYIKRFTQNYLHILFNDKFRGEQCNAPACQDTILKILRYTSFPHNRSCFLTWVKMRPPGEGYDARRWPEGPFVLCGGKCPFGPLACHIRCCPWDASEHILSLRLRYPSWHPDN